MYQNFATFFNFFDRCRKNSCHINSVSVHKPLLHYSFVDGMEPFRSASMTAKKTQITKIDEILTDGSKPASAHEAITSKVISKNAIPE